LSSDDEMHFVIIRQETLLSVAREDSPSPLQHPFSTISGAAVQAKSQVSTEELPPEAALANCISGE
jgi:hypothetical protein